MFYYHNVLPIGWTPGDSGKIWPVSQQAFFGFCQRGARQVLNPCGRCCKTLLCLASVTFLISFWHSSIVFLSITSLRWWIQASFWYMYHSSVLLTDLIHSFTNCLQAILIIWHPVGVLMVLFNLTLTGMTSNFRHLNENLLWLQIYASFFSISSHFQSLITLSSANSFNICRCRFLFLFGIIFQSELCSISLLTEYFY